MKVGTWLRSLVKRPPWLAHYLPYHRLGTAVDAIERTRCGKAVSELPLGMMQQEWRILLTADDNLPGVR